MFPLVGCRAFQLASGDASRFGSTAARAGGSCSGLHIAGVGAGSQSRGRHGPSKKVAQTQDPMDLADDGAAVVAPEGEESRLAAFGKRSKATGVDLVAAVPNPLQHLLLPVSSDKLRPEGAQGEDLGMEEVEERFVRPEAQLKDLEVRFTKYVAESVPKLVKGHGDVAHRGPHGSGLGLDHRPPGSLTKSWTGWRPTAPCTSDCKRRKPRRAVGMREDGAAVRAVAAGKGRRCGWERLGAAQEPLLRLGRGARPPWRGGPGQSAEHVVLLVWEGAAASMRHIWKGRSRRDGRRMRRRGRSR